MLSHTMTSEDFHIAVLRLGFRPHRDARVNTHLGLTARALGANALYLTGNDVELGKSLEGVVRNFGGSFEVIVDNHWRRLIKGFDGVRVHLTMYGNNLNTIIEEIQMNFWKKRSILVVVGGEKVQKEVYDMVDFNVAIGNQPHSEIAALAVFLDRLGSGKELEREFDGKIHIEPYRDGKKQVVVREEP